jgi:tRNA-Thr(GGU) m(6)t(6)A37 methyltransferase TsaA
MKINIKPIGIIYSPYKDLTEIPCQAYKSKKIGRVKVFNKFAEGLQDIDGFSHIILLYYFHKSKECKLKAKPFLDNTPKGIFAIRGPHRPNHSS